MVRHVFATEGLTNDHYIGIVIRTPQLDRPVRYGFRRAKRINFEAVAYGFDRVLQSHKEFQLDNTVTVNVLTMERRAGSGGRTRLKLDHLLSRKSQRALFVPPTMPESPHLCFGMALAYGMAHTNGEKLRMRCFRRSPRTLLRAAYDLHTRCGVVPDHPCGLEDVRVFQAMLGEFYCLRVYDNTQQLFKGSETLLSRPIYLLLTENHYCTILALARFFSGTFYCTFCEKTFRHKDEHWCALRCQACFCKHCPDHEAFAASAGQSSLRCAECCRFFFGPTCLQAHKCGNKRVCDKCERAFDGRKKHRCGTKYCKRCQEFVEIGPEHACFLPCKFYKRIPISEASRPLFLGDDDDIPMEEAEEEEEEEEEEEGVINVGDLTSPRPERTVVDNRCRYIYFDIEAQQETGIHVPNLLICQTDTGEEKRFRGETCVNEFLDYLLAFEHNSTVIAHNFKGYDGFPVLKTLLDHLLVPDVIYAWGKLLSVTCRKEKIRFVDSLNFLVMPLASFPKAFDLRLDETSER